MINLIKTIGLYSSFASAIGNFRLLREVNELAMTKKENEQISLIMTKQKNPTSFVFELIF